MLKRMTIQEDESRALLAHPTQSRLFSRKETPYKKKAPEAGEILTVPALCYFALYHASLNPYNLALTIHINQMFHGF